MPQVPVARIEVGRGLEHGNSVLLRVAERVLARHDVPFAPRRDHRELRREREIGELEAHLIVALAGAAVRERIGAEPFGAPHLTGRDQGSRQRGAEQVAALVDGSGAQRGEAEVAHERQAQVLHHHVARAELAGPGFESFQLGALADVGTVANDLAAVVLAEPLHDDAGVEPARIGEHRAFRRPLAVLH